MSGERRTGVGFVRGSLAVLRGSAHVAGKVLAVSGKALAALTSRSKRTNSD